MIYLNQLGMVCPLGNTHEIITRRMLVSAQTGLVMTDAYSPGRVLPVGGVDTQLPPVDELAWHQRSRNNQLALAALIDIKPAVAAAIERFGASRVGVIIGTSTSGIAEGEAALRRYHATGTLPVEFHYCQQELCSSAAMLAETMGVSGPAYVHSSACASSAKALASAARLLQMNLCDAVLAGGVDSLCAFTVAGFMALESVSAAPCNPLSVNRNGINIGEGAALFLMSREPASVALRGWGESSDGHHMSAPDPALPTLNVAEPGTSLGRPLRWVLSNSFAFGGANATLVLGRE